MLLKNSDLSQVMIKRSISVKPSTSILESREIMYRHRIGRLIVLGSKNRPVGIITEKDIAKSIYQIGNKSIKSIKVADYMSKNLITVKKSNSVYDCAKLMKNRKISSVIVLNDDKSLAGLVTKSELVRSFLTQATSSLKVSSIMTKNVITVKPSDSVLLVESLLVNNRITRIVVERKRVPVGIITHRNFLPAKLPHWIAESADPKEVENFRAAHLTEMATNPLAHLLPFKAVDIMTPNPITVDSNEDVSVAALLMIRHDISGLPVVRKTLLAGIITKTDIVNAIAKG